MLEKHHEGDHYKLFQNFTSVNQIVTTIDYKLFLAQILRDIGKSARFCAENQNNRKDKTMKKLFRSNVDKKLCGVCGGIAEYFELDSTIIRLLWVLLTFCSFGSALIAYFVCALIVPTQP